MAPQIAENANPAILDMTDARQIATMTVALCPPSWPAWINPKIASTTSPSLTRGPLVANNADANRADVRCADGAHAAK